MKKFYITTAIDYANSNPHLGTAYEKIGADVLARYKKLKGYDVHFVMGNDEHSQNVYKKAKEVGMEPKAYCDEMAEKFKAAWKKLLIEPDTFIQTSHDEHALTVRNMAQAIFEEEHDGEKLIYKAPYEGMYCVSCEAFYKEDDLVDGLCPNHKTKPEWIREENYFFRLSAFTEFLKHLHAEKENEEDNFLRPASRRNEIRQVLEKGLEDVSISRAGTPWGVPLPFDEDAVAYVWFDALINYYTARSDEEGNDYWPAQLHVIGKDITRFHTLIWPAMLKAAGLNLPERVWAHGFVSIQGEKMSKSRGNVADPVALADAFGPDTIRYHLMREVPWDKDGDFSEERLIARYNADLANDLGNLLNRTLNMVQKYFDGKIERPEGTDSKDPKMGEIAKIVSAYQEKMDGYHLASALEGLWKLVSGGNQYINDQEPWKKAKDEAQKNELPKIFYVVLEHLRLAATCLHPVMPGKMAELLDALGLSEEEIMLGENYIPPGEYTSYKTTKPDPLFPRLES